jgi:hypothetical protein
LLSSTTVCTSVLHEAKTVIMPQPAHTSIGIDSHSTRE